MGVDGVLVDRGLGERVELGRGVVEPLGLALRQGLLLLNAADLADVVPRLLAGGVVGTAATLEHRDREGAGHDQGQADEPGSGAEVG